MFKKFFIFKNVDNQMRPRATLNLIIMTIIIIIIIIIINDIDEVLVIPSLEADHATNLPKENIFKSLYAKTRAVQK